MHLVLCNQESVVFSLQCLVAVRRLRSCGAVSDSTLASFQPAFTQASLALVPRCENGSASAMNPLAVIGEVRTQVNSIKNRIANYRSGPDTFRTLTRNVDRLTKHVTEMKALLSSSPVALPPGISVVFRDTLAEVCDDLKSAHESMDQSLSKVFTESGSSAIDRLKSKGPANISRNIFTEQVG